MSTPDHLTIAQLIATPGGNWGGMEKHTADLVEELAAVAIWFMFLHTRLPNTGFHLRSTFHPLPDSVGKTKPIAKTALEANAPQVIA